MFLPFVCLACDETNAPFLAANRMHSLSPISFPIPSFFPGYGLFANVHNGNFRRAFPQSKISAPFEETSPLPNCYFNLYSKSFEDNFDNEQSRTVHEIMGDIVCGARESWTTDTDSSLHHCISFGNRVQNKKDLVRDGPKNVIYGIATKRRNCPSRQLLLRSTEDIIRHLSGTHLNPLTICSRKGTNPDAFKCDLLIVSRVFKQAQHQPLVCLFSNVLA